MGVSLDPATRDRLDWIRGLPEGWKDPSKDVEGLPHINQPWEPVPPELFQLVEYVILEVLRVGFPPPVVIDPIMPYMGWRGVKLEWCRDPTPHDTEALHVAARIRHPLHLDTALMRRWTLQGEEAVFTKEQDVGRFVEAILERLRLVEAEAPLRGSGV